MIPEARHLINRDENNSKKKIDPNVQQFLFYYLYYYSEKLTSTLKKFFNCVDYKIGKRF